MSEGGSLINLGDVSKPATVLIEKISDAVGGIAKPWQIERVAKAEAKAELIRAQGKIEISELEERALARMVREEGKRQENIESITAKAIPYLSKDAEPEKVEQDWLTHFFDRCRLISDGEMQTLWAKILAGQANKPGAFSKRTVELIATLDKEDAQLFTQLCTFVWWIEDHTLVIYDFKDPVYERAGLAFSTLNHLDDIGLVTLEGLSSFSREPFGKYTTVSYFGRYINIEFPGNDKNQLQVGQVIFTRAGRELAPHCGATPCEDYFSYVLSRWMGLSYLISSPVQKQHR